MAKKLTPAEQRMQEKRAQLEQRMQEKRAQLQQRQIQRMQERNARMEAQLEARHQERLKQICIDALKKALKEDLDVSSYITYVEEQGFNFEECLQIAIAQRTEDIQREYLEEKKEHFTQFLQDLLTKDPELQINNLNFERIEEDWGYTENEVRSMLVEIITDMYNSIFYEERRLDEPNETNMKKLYALGTHLSMTKQSIDEKLLDIRTQRKYYRLEDDFIEKHKKLVWISIVVLSIIEIITIRWWSILTIPATFILFPIYNTIAKLVFRCKFKK